MNCPINKKHKVLMIEDPEIYDGISYIYCFKCKKLYDRWTGKDITNEHKYLIKEINQPI